MPGTNCRNGGGAEIDWGTLSGEGKVTPRADIEDFVNVEKISYHALTLLNQMATLSQTPSVYIYVCLTALLLHLESSEIRSALCV